jgi:hypothetical protein
MHKMQLESKERPLVWGDLRESGSPGEAGREEHSKRGDARAKAWKC